MYSEVYSTTIFGLSAHIVTVEADVSMGLPVFEMSGYLTSEVKEARERIKVAIRNSGEELRPQRMIVNISPADLRKDGTGFDLPIAVSLLCALGMIKKEKLMDTIILGELSLNGSVNRVNGVLSSIIMAQESGFKRCIVPAENVQEAALTEQIEIIGIHTLRELIDYLNGSQVITEVSHNISMNTDVKHEKYELDFQDIKGQYAAKRATLVAVAGMHNIMYVGAPGSGKTMMAKRIPTIMPSLSFQESLELTKIYSVAGMLNQHEALVKKRPFRSPHHNITSAALLGGGRIPKPGEITLAGKGVLFLDEMTEYKTSVIEALRQPLEERKITISRLNYACDYPADFMLAAAINPCKCGYFPDRKRCNCSEYDIRRYLGKISTPIWDRFDITIQVEVPKFIDMSSELWLKKDYQSVDNEESKITNADQNKLYNTKKDYIEKRISKEKERYYGDENGNLYTSEYMRSSVERVRQIQLERFADTEIRFNSQMSAREIQKYCQLGEQEMEFMKKVYHKLNLTGRGYHKILKTARTIADLDQEKEIGIAHISEAVSYRSYDMTMSQQRFSF